MFSKIGMALISGLSNRDKVFWRYKGTTTIADGTEITNGLFYSYQSQLNPLKFIDYSQVADSSSKSFSGWNSNGQLITPLILKFFRAYNL